MRGLVDRVDANTRHPGAPPVYVVGVGASAGGLEALEQLFAVMPPEAGMAFVVVQHLSPDFKSIMDELLARRTRIPVLLVEDGMHVEPNHIYLIPPAKEMIISGGRLLLTDKGTSQELTLPIDIFFRSLAQDAGPRAIAVVLSGTGSDGSRGIRDIHEAGGLVICQDEKTAAFDGMPRSAQDTGVVDHVLAPSEIPPILTSHVRRLESSIENIPQVPTRTPTGINAVFQLLQDAYGIDFSFYKPSTVVRRIDRRLQLAQAESIDDYVSRVACDAFELDALYRDLLIGVTRFFRDEEVFDFVAEKVLPEILQKSSAGNELRFWVPGCATGEEAYSFAIILHELLEKRGEHRRVKIFATDVHSGSLELATRGLYTAESIAHLSPARASRYFEMHGPNVQISPELRQMVVFARHNVVKDPPFTRVDLISCRNLLIYLQPLAQKKVLSLFHFALKRQGALILGPSESPGAFAEDFEVLNGHWRIYRKQRDLATGPMPRMPARGNELRQVAPATVGTHYSLTQTIGIYDALLDRYMPASLLVNDKRELLHTFGGASRFLKISDGRPSLDLLDMVGPELKLALTGSMQRALKSNSPIAYKSLSIGEGEDTKLYDLTLTPVTARQGTSPHLLISIVESGGAPRVEQAATEIAISDVSRNQLSMIEAELNYTKENLQATIEELETSNEELQATNEELLASNEELQSTNEELQSVNEELYTVNAEYQKKIAQLTELTNDVDNLLLSTEVGTIFLDLQLCIRKFTPRIAAMFNLLPQDVGRPITAFSAKINHPDLMDDLASVLKTQNPVELELRGEQGNWFFLRILPYRAKGQAVGVVLTLIDITTLKSAEDALFRERYLLESLLHSVPDLIYFKDARGRFVRVNRAMAQRLGLARPEEAVGKRASDLLPAAEAEIFDRADQVVLGGTAQPYRVEEHRRTDGSRGWLMTTRQPLEDREGKIIGMFAVARDVTDQKNAEEETRLAVKRRDDFLAMLSHELRNPLGAIVCASKLAMCQAGEGSPWSKDLEVIERQSGQMARLLDDLLEASRITQNKIELHRRVLDVRSIAEEALSALGRVFTDRGLELKVDLGNQAVMVDADPARIQQILVNLLGNSAKYTESGGHVRLQVGVERDEAVIIVGDDGAGIDPSMLTTIFDLFVQGRATLARTEGGMGVGLTLVRALVQMHGGTVTAHSDGIGRGSTFVVRLPIAKGMIAHTKPESGRIFPDHARSVAVVDDNPDGRSALRDLLELAGYEVHCANDAESALALVEKQPLDVAIIDIGLPGMDGYELARRLRGQKERANLYLVALTGYGQPSDRAAALAAGFDDHLVKPLHPAQLERIVRHRESPPLLPG